MFGFWNNLTRLGRITVTFFLIFCLTGVSLIIFPPPNIQNEQSQDVNYVLTNVHDLRDMALGSYVSFQGTVIMVMPDVVWVEDSGFFVPVSVYYENVSVGDRVFIDGTLSDGTYSDYSIVTDAFSILAHNYSISDARDVSEISRSYTHEVITFTGFVDDFNTEMVSQDDELFASLTVGNETISLYLLSQFQDFFFVSGNYSFKTGLLYKSPDFAIVIPYEMIKLES